MLCMVSAEGGERGGGLRGEQRSGRAALGSDRAVWAGPIFPSLLEGSSVHTTQFCQSDISGTHWVSLLATL